MTDCFLVHPGAWGETDVKKNQPLQIWFPNWPAPAGVVGDAWLQGMHYPVVFFNQGGIDSLFIGYDAQQLPEFRVLMEIFGHGSLILKQGLTSASPFRCHIGGDRVGRHFNLINHLT